MATEIKTERDPWDFIGLGTERQVVYEDGVKVSTITEERTFITGETVRVIRDNDGTKVAVIRREEEHIPLIGNEKVERIYDPNGNQIAEIRDDRDDSRQRNISNRQGEKVGKLEVREDGIAGGVVGLKKTVFTPSYGKNPDLFGRTQKSAVTLEKKTQSHVLGNEGSSGYFVPQKNLDGKVDQVLKLVGAIAVFGGLVFGISEYFDSCGSKRTEPSSGPGTISKPYQPLYQQSQPHSGLGTYQSPKPLIVPKEQRKQPVKKIKKTANNHAGQNKNYELQNPLDSLQQGFKEFEKTRRKIYEINQFYIRKGARNK